MANGVNPATVQEFGGGEIYRAPRPPVGVQALGAIALGLQGQAERKKSELEHQRAMEKAVAREVYLKDYYDAQTELARAGAEETWRYILGENYRPPASRMPRQQQQPQGARGREGGLIANLPVIGPTLRQIGGFTGEVARTARDFAKTAAGDKGEEGTRVTLNERFDTPRSKESVLNILRNRKGSPEYERIRRILVGDGININLAIRILEEETRGRRKSE